MQRTYLVDTNIFLEIMLSQTRKEECKKILAMLSEGKILGVVTDFTIYSIMILLDRFKKHEQLRIFLSSLTAYKALYIYATSLADKVKAVETSKKTGLGIDDAIQYVTALSLNADAIISYDKHFDKVKLPRKEPVQIIAKP